MDPLQQGIAAARQGRRAEAKKLFQQALQANLDNEQAWLWLSTVVETQAERQVCLERALSFNPQNQIARAELEKLTTDSQSPPGTQTGHQVSSPTVLENPSQVALPTSTPSAETLRFQAIGGLVSQPTTEPDETSGISEPCPTQRLSPHQPTTAGDISTWADQVQETDPAATPSNALLQSEKLKATVIIGCLSVTALSGLLVLVILLLVGWPP